MSKIYWLYNLIHVLFILIEGHYITNIEVHAKIKTE
jgi:hypothetical protein